ncbi:hypothetical protein ACHAXN_007478 [Cyclotella atomus]
MRISYLTPLYFQIIEAFIQSSPSIRENINDATSTSTADPKQLFPVISKIAGLQWTGSCRYINQELKPVSNLKLSGGTKYEISGTSLTLSSFLTFPNGKTREVVMKGVRRNVTSEHEMITLEPIDEEGPIIMKLSEVYPDTILINEEEKATGRTFMTSSISVVEGMKRIELIGVSHEVGDEINGMIEGHQIWRMTASSPSAALDFRNATGQ